MYERRLVEDEREERLCCAGVLDHLPCKEEPRSSIVVVGSVVGRGCRCVRSVGGEFEEEDQTVDGTAWLLDLVDELHRQAERREGRTRAV